MSFLLTSIVRRLCCILILFINSYLLKIKAQNYMFFLKQQICTKNAIPKIL